MANLGREWGCGGRAKGPVGGCRTGIELDCGAEGYGGTRPEHVYMGPCRSLEVCYCMVKVTRLGQGCGTHIRSRRLWKDKVSIGLLSRLYPGGGCGKSGYGVGWSR